MVHILGMFLILTWLLMFSFIEQGNSFAIQGCDVHGQLYPKVLCYKRDLNHVPEHLPQATTMLDISFNRIKMIKTKDFSNVTHLQQLNVSNNHIHVIERGSFTNLPALKVLNLNHNNLILLNNSIFEGLKNVSTLLLNNNSIISILQTAFSPLENLNVLDLSYNPLRTLGSLRSVFQIKSLTEIGIANISLQHFLTSDLENVSVSLHTIDISRNPLALIRFSSDVLKGLTSLTISFSGPNLTWTVEDSCFLKGLNRIIMEGVSLNPAAILDIFQTLSCSSLQEANLGYLNLSDSDCIIQELCLKQPKIQTLYLQNNNYSGFQINTFQNCSNLKFLDLSHNQLMLLSESAFDHLTSLEHLTLAGNKLSVLPSNLFQMVNLERMNLSFNHLKQVYLNDTKSYGKLKTLDLSGNMIYVFRSSSSVVWSLAALNLGQNHILDISESFGRNLRNLKSLIVRANKLSSLSSNTFENLTSLKFLNLVDNQIEHIEAGAFKGLQNLKTLLFGSNRLTRASFQNKTFQGLEMIEELQLFSNYIEYESSDKLTVPPFHSMKTLKLLTLNSQGHNGMRYLPVNLLEGLVTLRKVILGNLALTAIDNKVLSYIPQLNELDFSNNHIVVLDTNLFKPVSNLTELHLNRMSLESLNFLDGLNFTKLKIFRAAGNQLKTFNETHYKALPFLMFLDLRDNPMFCSCDNKWFINWSRNDLKTQVLDFYDYRCDYPPGNRGQRLATFNVDSCRPGYDFILFLSTTVFISLWLLSSTVWKLWRWRVFYLYYIILGYIHEKKHRRNRQNFKYDAFISYNCRDEEWVFNELVPNLENTYHWKLCLHHRDFEPGKPIVDNIIDNIYSSRKTICVISRHYLASEWCSKEMQVASYRLFDEHNDVLILLFLEKISNRRLSLYHQFRRMVKKKTYLLWPRNADATAVFWQKVNQALTAHEVLEVENDR